MTNWPSSEPYVAAHSLRFAHSPRTDARPEAAMPRSTLVGRRSLAVPRPARSPHGTRSTQLDAILLDSFAPLSLRLSPTAIRSAGAPRTAAANRDVFPPTKASRYYDPALD